MGVGTMQVVDRPAGVGQRENRMALDTAGSAGDENWNVGHGGWLAKPPRKRHPHLARYCRGTGRSPASNSLKAMAALPSASEDGAKNPEYEH
jgi:hypothetical protein